MYRVEFIGVPGSGKTTIRKKIVGHLKKIDNKQFLSVEEAILAVSKKKIDKVYRIILNSLPKRLALIFSDKLLNRTLLQYNAQNKFLAEWAKLFEIFFASSTFKSMSVCDREILISSLMEAGSLYECINNQFPHQTVVFFEEGFIQKSFMYISPSIATYVQSDVTSLNNYLNNIPLPDLTIYVKTDLSLCYQRMKSRPDGLTKRLQKIDKDRVLKFLETSDSHLQSTIDWLKKNKDINLFEINNERDLASATQDLEKMITTLF